MTTIDPSGQVSETAELLQSLQASVRRVRQQAEAMCEDLQSHGEADVALLTRQIAAVEGLIRTCQKVEISLVEQYERQAGIGQSGYALDLDRARAEIRGRMDRLRAGQPSDQISRGDD